jgi:hypothetical protein
LVSDSEARDAVRQLMDRFETISSQGNALAYVLAKKDLNEYARLLEAAERAIPTVVQPLVDADPLRGQVHAALDDPNGDWPKAVMSMLNRGPIILTGDQALDQIRRLNEPD